MRKQITLASICSTASLTGLIAGGYILLSTPVVLAEGSCNATECTGPYQPADFWITVASDNGINARLLPDTKPQSRSGDILPKGMRLHCIGWQYGEKVKALGLNTYDARWYLVEVPGIPNDLSHGYLGNTRYVPAAWVFGDAPGSKPLP